MEKMETEGQGGTMRWLNSNRQMARWKLTDDQTETDKQVDNDKWARWKTQGQGGTKR